MPLRISYGSDDMDLDNTLLCTSNEFGAYAALMGCEDDMVLWRDLDEEWQAAQPQEDEE